MLFNRIIDFQRKRIKQLEDENKKYNAACGLLYAQLEIEKAIVEELKRNNAEREAVIEQREKELAKEFKEVEHLKENLKNILSSLIQTERIIKGGE